MASIYKYREYPKLYTEYPYHEYLDTNCILPIYLKRVNKIPGSSVEIQEIQALQTLHDILVHLLRPLSDSRCQEGYEMVCADGNIRLCFPKLVC